MPTILTHPAVPLALGIGLGSKVIPRPLLAAGAVVSIVPDLDVVAFRFGIAYASDFGHRGFSHSLMFAALAALLGACAWRLYPVSFWRAYLFLFIATASHGVLDAFTNGGLGIALLWPWSNARFFFEPRVIEVSPLSISHFLAGRGAEVIGSELLWIWAPCLFVTAVLVVFRRALFRR